MRLTEAARLWKMAMRIAKENKCVCHDFEIFEALLAQVMFKGSWHHFIWLVIADKDSTK